MFSGSKGGATPFEDDNSEGKSERVMRSLGLRSACSRTGCSSGRRLRSAGHRLQSGI